VIYLPQNYVRNGNYPTRCANIAGFSSDARVAITQAPDYFVTWYTLKSIGLGVAVGIIGFLIGRASKR